MNRSDFPADVLARTGVMREGHFALSPKHHTSSFVDPDLLFCDPIAGSSLAIDLAKAFERDEVDVVAGPAQRATTIVSYTAKSLYIWQDQKRVVRPVYGEKSGCRPLAFRFRKAFLPVIRGNRVLVVDDFMFSGETMRAFTGAVREAGGVIVGAGVICNRGEVTAEMLGIPRLHALVSKREETWKRRDCPMCKQGIPLDPL